MNIEELLRKQTKTVGNLSEERLVFVRNKNLQSILNRFDKEEHRLEFVTKFRGVTFINDAKADNHNALYYTLGTIKQKIIWITGSNDGFVDYKDLLDTVSQKVKVIICVGKNATQIKQVFANLVPTIYERDHMEEAVMTAFYSAEENETVLLSSAGPCDDKFFDYKDMGNQFRNAIAQL